MSVPLYSGATGMIEIIAMTNPRQREGASG
jgi:hypothetical protein